MVKSTGLNYSSPEIRDLIRGGSNPSSLASQLFSASKLNTTFIAKPASSWIDDYIDWSNNEHCCQYNKSSHDFCPNQIHSSMCGKCEFHHLPGRDGDDLSPQDFNTYISYFLRDNPSQDCPKGGHAAYGNGVILSNKSSIGANYFMTYHSVLKKSEDYTNALREARSIALNITNTLNSGKHDVTF